MSDQDAFERILASLYDAMLDDAHWPATSALIDEACGITGNALMVGEGPKDDLRVLFVGLYYRGQRREDLEREYLEVYHPTDERIPRFRQLPDSHLVHIKELFTAEELQTSPTYNEALLRAKHQDSLAVRLDGPDGSHMSWILGDPVSSEGWGSSEITMVQALLPHIRQFIRVRQALVRAQARDTTVTTLLDNPRIGVLHLDQRGRIMAVNDRARSSQASSTVFSQFLPFVSLTLFLGFCFRSQRLRLARLRGEFPDGFFTVVAATAMLYGLRSTWLQQWFSNCHRPARRKGALCRAGGPTFPNRYPLLRSLQRKLQ